MRKKEEDKDILTTLKKHSYCKICGILKLLKLKRTLKVLYHIFMKYNLHDVLRKVPTYYKRKHKNVIN